MKRTQTNAEYIHIYEEMYILRYTSGTLSENGREKGILSGANVVMPNLTPATLRSKYSIYNNKASTGCESAEEIEKLEKELSSIGYHINYSKGDHKQTE